MSKESSGFNPEKGLVIVDGHMEYVDGEPRAVIDSDGEVVVLSEDVSHLPPDKRWAVMRTGSRWEELELVQCPQ